MIALTRPLAIKSPSKECMNRYPQLNLYNSSNQSKIEALKGISLHIPVACFFRPNYPVPIRTNEQKSTVAVQCSRPAES